MSKNSLHILLVEDDPGDAAMATAFMEMDGHTVTHRDTAEDALAFHAQVVGGEVVCHAVVVDYNLNHGDPTNMATTTPVIEAFRTTHPHIPLIGFSGVPMEQNGFDPEIFAADPTKNGYEELPTIIASLYE